VTDEFWQVLGAWTDQLFCFVSEQNTKAYVLTYCWASARELFECAVKVHGIKVWVSTACSSYKIITAVALLVSLI